jgi:hypothetical protein
MADKKAITPHKKAITPLKKAKKIEATKTLLVRF